LNALLNLKSAVERRDLTQFFGQKRFGKTSPDHCGETEQHEKRTARAINRLDFSEAFLLQTPAQSRTSQLPNLG
jgi:hypothetical protein